MDKKKSYDICLMLELMKIAHQMQMQTQTKTNGNKIDTKPIKITLIFSSSSYS